MNRRRFLNTLGVAGASTVVAGGGEAEASTVVAPPNAYGVLVDTTTEGPAGTLAAAAAALTSFLATRAARRGAGRPWASYVSPPHASC